MSKRILPCLLLFVILLCVAASIQSSFAIEEISNTILNPSPFVQLTFSGIFPGLTSTAAITTQYPLLQLPSPGLGFAPATLTITPTSNGFVEVWDIKVKGTFDGMVVVKIHPSNGALVTQMFQTDLVMGDINRDGKVNSLDLLIVAHAMGSRQGCRGWSPNCDLNCDHKIDMKDLCIAIHNFGKTSTWEEITLIPGSDADGYFVVGETDHFSLFGVR